MQVPGRRTPERTGSRGDSYHGAWPELGDRRTTPSSRLRLSRLRPSRGRGPTQDMPGRMQLPRSRSQLWPAGSCTRSSGNKDCKDRPLGQLPRQRKRARSGERKKEKEGGRGSRAPTPAPPVKLLPPPPPTSPRPRRASEPCGRATSCRAELGTAPGVPTPPT